jgi:hypothetical protein
MKTTICILALSLLLCSCGAQNSVELQEPLPPMGYVLNDIYQGSIPDCWVLSVLGAFVVNAPQRLAAALDNLHLPADPGHTPVFNFPGVNEVELNVQLDLNRANWVAQVELALRAKNVDILKDGWVEDAAVALALDDNQIEWGSDPRSASNTAPLVGCTNGTVMDKRLVTNHCYTVTRLEVGTAELFDLHGTLFNVPLPSRDLTFVGF